MTLASLAGTKRFAENARKNDPQIHESHFSESKALRLVLSSIGMGTYLGDPDRETDSLVESAVLESLSRGVNVFDTAINYRWQKGERSLGKALNLAFAEKEITREQIFVSSKVGYIPGDADTHQ